MRSLMSLRSSRSGEVERMKTGTSNRVLPIPEHLASYIETYIEAFHANSAPTPSELGAVPGSKILRKGGVSRGPEADLPIQHVLLFWIGVDCSYG